jgi:hypothetical protein
MAKRRTVAMLALLFASGGCDAPGEWSAFVYPDRHDHTKYEKTDGFQSLSYCRDQAIEQMKAVQVNGGGDYLCGHKCGPPREPGGPELCEETLK